MVLYDFTFFTETADTKQYNLFVYQLYHVKLIIET